MENEMAKPSTILTELSTALMQLAAGAQQFVASVRTRQGDEMTGVLWTPNAVVVSEQALSDAEEFEVSLAGGSATGRVAGRDEGTNVAILKLDRDFPGRLPPAHVPNVGGLALAVGAGANGPTARLAALSSVGGPWQSLAGGTIDHRIVLDRYLGSSSEGAPVLAADGSIVGVAARGAARETLVIPASTVNRVVPVLLEKGTIQRGWLGVALRPVALPESLRPEQSQRVGLMVMDVAAGGPAEKAGVLAGDILLAVGGALATRPSKIARQLGAGSIGQTLELKLARAGAILTSKPVVEARVAR
jgi:S1-C subfamily serine protease